MIDTVEKTIEQKDSFLKKFCNLSQKDFIILSTTKKYAVWKVIEVNLSIYSSLVYLYFAAYRRDLNYLREERDVYMSDHETNFFSD